MNGFKLVDSLPEYDDEEYDEVTLEVMARDEFGGSLFDAAEFVADKLRTLKKVEDIDAVRLELLRQLAKHFDAYGFNGPGTAGLLREFRNIEEQLRADSGDSDEVGKLLKEFQNA